MSQLVAPGSAAADPVAAAAAPERLPASVCYAFGIGSTGCAILLNTVSTFFPALMATVLGQSAAVGGLLLGLSKLYDAGADFAIGAASDRTRTRIGRRRPFLLAGAIVSMLAMLMIFLPPPIVGLALTLYMGVALVIYSTGYSLFGVPYIAMAGEMTDSYHERTRLFSYRVFFISIGQIIAVAGASYLITWGGGGSRGFAVMGAVMAVLAGATLLVSFLGTAKARQAEPIKPPKMPLGEKVRLLLANKPLVMLISSKVCQYMSIAVISTTKLLFMLNVLKLGYIGQVNLSIAQNVAAAISMPVWIYLGRRYGKKPAYMVAIVMLALVYASWIFTGPGLPYSSLWIRGALTGFASGGMILMGLAMLPDTMEYDRLRTGLQREGVFSSLYAIVEKGGYAIGPMIVGLLLAGAGYIPTVQGKLTAQPESAVQALYVCTAILPTLLLLISLACIAGYSLSERKMIEARAAALVA